VLAIQPTLERHRPLTAIDLIAVLHKLPFDLSPQEQTFLPRDSIDVDGCATSWPSSRELPVPGGVADER
jgi:hypothetical protein